MTTNAEMTAALAIKLNLPKAETKRITDNYHELITDHLALGEEISLIGIGKLEVKATAAREGRNPRTGETVQIEAGKKVAFKVSKTLKGRLNG
jgi:DNA-binding protein HU-beta